MKIFALLIFLVLAPLVLRAADDNIPAAEITTAYTFVHLNPTAKSDEVNAQGATGTLGLSVFPHVSALGSATAVRSDGSNITALQAGLQVNSHQAKVNFFVHGLGGGAWLDGEHSSILTAGGGVEFKLSKHIWLRPIEADYIRTNFGSLVQNMASYSGGLTFRLGTR